MSRRGFAQYLSEKLHGCPCGYYGDSERECTCSMTLVSRYQKRLSGPLLDRTLAPHASAGVDIAYGVVTRHVEVQRVPFHTCPPTSFRSVPRGTLSDPRCAGQVRSSWRVLHRHPGARRRGAGAPDRAIRRRQGQQEQERGNPAAAAHQRRHTCTCVPREAQVQVYATPAPALPARASVGGCTSARGPTIASSSSPAPHWRLRRQRRCRRPGRIGRHPDRAHRGGDPPAARREGRRR